MTTSHMMKYVNILLLLLDETDMTKKSNNDATLKATKPSYFILQLGFLSILWTEKNATWLPKPVED